MFAASGCSGNDEAAPETNLAADSTTTTNAGVDTTTAAVDTTDEAVDTTATPVDTTDESTTSVVEDKREVDIGGLTVLVAPDAIVPDPESGVVLTDGSVYKLPGESFEELETVDVTNRVVESADGEPVIIYLFGSDTLFDVGSSTVKSNAEVTFPAVIASIAQRSPNGRILVRGFTDSAGSDESNQVLSEQRATAVAERLASNGLDLGRVETAGYGSSVPAAEESTPEGTALNRRIEIVVIG